MTSNTAGGQLYKKTIHIDSFEIWSNKRFAKPLCSHKIRMLLLIQGKVKDEKKTSKADGEHARNCSLLRALNCCTHGPMNPISDEIANFTLETVFVSLIAISCQGVKGHSFCYEWLIKGPNMASRHFQFWSEGTNTIAAASKIMGLVCDWRWAFPI